MLLISDQMGDAVETLVANFISTTIYSDKSRFLPIIQFGACRNTQFIPGYRARDLVMKLIFIHFLMVII